MMRKVFLDNLPKKGARINWKESIGYSVSFIYDEIIGEVEIKAYDGKKITIYSETYEDCSIFTGHFKDGKLGVYLEKMLREHRFKIHEVVYGLEILDCIRTVNKGKERRAYKYRCTKCGDEDIVDEYNLMKKKIDGCHVCNGSGVLKGFNDIATTNPEVIKFLVNPSDGFCVSSQSDKKLELRCPFCKTGKSSTVANLTGYGFTCNVCGKNGYYPEKFFANMLMQLEIDFLFQVTKSTFEWMGNKRYDFYIPVLDMIVETHGIQHYIDSNLGDLQSQQKNDRDKFELAKEYVKHYVVIDCRESNKDWIKNEILESELANLLDLSKVKWEECHKEARVGRIQEACELWNLGATRKEISEMLHLTPTTISKYLIQGNELGLCEYSFNSSRERTWGEYHMSFATPIYCETIDKRFRSISSVIRYFEINLGVKVHHKYIKKVCEGSLQNHKGYIFSYIDNHERYKLI